MNTSSANTYNSNDSLSNEALDDLFALFDANGVIGGQAPSAPNPPEDALDLETGLAANPNMPAGNHPSNQQRLDASDAGDSKRDEEERAPSAKEDSTASHPHYLENVHFITKDMPAPTLAQAVGVNKSAPVSSIFAAALEATPGKRRKFASSFAGTSDAYVVFYDPDSDFNELVVPLERLLRGLDSSEQADHFPGLSSRTRKVLKTAGAFSPADIVKIGFSQFSRLPNCGKSTLEEIATYLDSKGLPSNKYFTAFPQITLSESAAKTAVELLEPPTNVLHRLRGRHIRTVGELATYGFARLAEEKGIGTESVKALYQRALSLEGVSNSPLIPAPTEQPAEHDTREELEHIEGVLLSPRLNVLLREEEPLKHALFRAFIISSLARHPLGLTAQQLESLPASRDVRLRLGDFMPVLAELVNEGEVAREGDIYQRKFPPLKEVIASCALPERVAQIILMRAAPHTLEEVGQAFGITRERVRQLTSRDAVEPLLRRSREGRLASVYAQYDATFEELAATFEADELEWGALRSFVRRHKQLLPFKVIVQDPLVPPMYRQRAQELRTRGFIEIDGTLVQAKRKEICHHLLKMHASEQELSEDDVLRLYDALLKDKGLAKESDLKLSASYLRGTLHRIDNVLTVQGRKLRYYDFEEHDIAALLAQLNLDGLENREFSARVFFFRQPELMEEFELLNEHELHNVIRRYAEANPQESLPVKIARRSPILYTGSPEGRDAQVLELARMLSPVSTKDLAREYEARYGVDPASFMANYIKCLEPFTSRGTINLNVSLPSDNELAQLRDALHKDWYSLGQLETIIPSACPRGRDAFNSATLWALGYTLYTDCALRSSWDNLYTYYTSLFDQPLINKGSLPEEVESARSFGAYLWHQLKNLELLDYDEENWITRKGLEALEISPSDLGAFYEDVRSWCVSNNELYATTHLVRTQCPKLALFSYDLADEFYGSVLYALAKTSTSFSVQGTKVLTFGDAQPSINGLLRHIVTSLGSAYVSDLERVMLERYGIALDQSRIREHARQTDLYYAGSIDRLYKSYDQFLSEVY